MRKVDFKTFLAAISLIAYLVVLFKVILFKFTIYHPSGAILKLGGYGDYGYNLTPFKTIGMYMNAFPLGIISVGNLLGNIALFMPLGVLVPLVYRSMRWKGIFVLAIVLSIGIEILQHELKSGATDIDDVILNTLGAMLGYIVFVCVRFILRLFSPSPRSDVI